MAANTFQKSSITTEAAQRMIAAAEAIEWKWKRCEKKRPTKLLPVGHYKITERFLESL